MTWTTSNFIFLGINKKHECHTLNGTPVGFITHKETDPTEFKATKKDVFNTTIAFDTFSTFKEAKDWLLSKDTKPQTVERIDLDPNKKIYIYMKGDYITQCKDLKRAMQVVSVDEERVRKMWAYSISDIQQKHYTFSHIKFRT